MKATKVQAQPITIERPYAVRGHGCYQIHQNGTIFHYRDNNTDKVQQFKDKVGDRVFNAVSNYQNPTYLNN